MGRIKTVCFDLDDTLIKEIHSVMYLSILNHKLDELKEIEREEQKGKYDWIEADYLKAQLAKGVPIKQVEEQFITILKPIKNVKEVMSILHEHNIKTILITAGPIQVAKAASVLWEMDGYDGSLYECEIAFFTGRILSHLGDKGKVSALEKFCLKEGIQPSECMAIGDGATDIPLFKYCGTSLGINCREEVAKEAKYSIVTDDLMDVLQYIEI